VNSLHPTLQTSKLTADTCVQNILENLIAAASIVADCHLYLAKLTPFFNKCRVDKKYLKIIKKSPAV